MQLPQEIMHALGSKLPIYALSPHIDDAIWSAGGLLQFLADQGREVTLVSIFTHSIYVFDEIWPPAEATMIRKSEDYNAAHAAYFKQVIFADFPDGILRDTPQTKVINPEYETPPYLLNMITKYLKKLLPEESALFLPAGFGGHMDHLTTRRAALPLKQPKILYKDMPYGSRDSNNEEVLDFLKNGWKHINLKLDDTLLQKHLDLFWHYKSQASDEVAQEIKTQLSGQGQEVWVKVE